MKNRERSFSDPFDLPNLGTGLVGRYDRVCMHKVVATGNSEEKLELGQGKLELYEDSRTVKPTDLVIEDYGKNSVLYTHDSRKQEIHTHKRGKERHIYTYRNPWYPHQSLAIHAVMRYPGDNIE